MKVKYMINEAFRIQEEGVAPWINEIENIRFPLKKFIVVLHSKYKNIL